VRRRRSTPDLDGTGARTDIALSAAQTASADDETAGAAIP